MPEPEVLICFVQYIHLNYYYQLLRRFIYFFNRVDYMWSNAEIFH